MKLLLMFPCKQANAVGETVQKTKQNKEEKQKTKWKHCGDWENLH